MSQDGDIYRFPSDLPSSDLSAVRDQLSYPELRKFTWHNSVPRFERFIYRYSSVDASSDDSKSRLEDVLLRSRLWLSSPQDFNDPFDCRAFVPLERDPLVKRSKLDKLIRTHEPHLGWGARQKKVDWMMSWSPEQWQRDGSAIVNKNSGQLGISCFTADPKNLLMWSHYAKSHTGFCLQFETLKHLDVFGRALPVEYTTSYPEFNVFTFTEDDITRFMLSKFKDWKYEKELRITAPDGARKKLPFNPAALTGIVIGVRTAQDTKIAIREILNKRDQLGLPPLRLYRAAQHPTSYRLVVEKTEFT